MKINSTRKFDRQLGYLIRKNGKYNTKVNRILKLLNFDLRHPSLRLHKISGVGGVHSVSVDMKIRIILAIDGDSIHLIEIGNHDQVY